MVITQNYKNAFTEVYVILNHLKSEEYEKIPETFLTVIENNRNLDYEYEINEDLDLNTQPMMKETRAILFNVYRDYLSSSEQKAKILKMQNIERQKNEEEKRLQFNPNDIFKKKNVNKDNEINKSDKQENCSALVNVKKENFIVKIINRLKKILKK